jgi:hypothetical protein
MNKELRELLEQCLTIVNFLIRYSAGHIHTEALKVKTRIEKYIEDETLYGKN